MWGLWSRDPRVKAGRAQPANREEAKAHWQQQERIDEPQAGHRRPTSVRNVALVGHSGSGKTNSGRGAAGRDRCHPAAGPGRGWHHGQRLRRGGDQAAALGQPHPRARWCTPGSRSTCSTRPATPTSPGICGPGCGRADAALFAVSATDGVDGLTRMLWEECAAVGMPRAVVITKLDHQRADFDAALAACRDAFGDSVAPLYLPVGGPGEAAA